MRDENQEYDKSQEVVIKYNKLIKRLAGSKNKPLKRKDSIQLSESAQKAQPAQPALIKNQADTLHTPTSSQKKVIRHPQQKKQ